MQNKHRKTPIELFTKTKVAINTKHFHTFGSPAYVLQNELQNGKPFHKWKERSKVGIYLGMSPIHGKNVALVLDRATGLVSPQFHVKIDSQFHSVEQDTYQSQWQIKAGLVSKMKHAKIDMDSNPNKRKHSPEAEADLQQHIPQSEGGAAASEGEKSRTSNLSSGNKRDQNKMRNTQTLQHKLTNESSAINERKRLKSSKVRQTKNSLKTQYGSTGKATPVALEFQIKPNKVQKPHLIEAMIAEVSRNTRDGIEGELLCLEAIYPNYHDQHQGSNMDQDPLMVFKATTDPDTMYLHKAMREPDWKEFQKAMEKEVQDQMDNGNYSIIKRSKVPKGKIILPAVWQMKRKRDIKTQKIEKYKARLNLDGSKQQKGIHYDQTYAPVASWKFIRLLLILIVKLG